MITLACDVEMDYRGANVESERHQRDVNIVCEGWAMTRSQEDEKRQSQDILGSRIK